MSSSEGRLSLIERDGHTDAAGLLGREELSSTFKLKNKT